jgi:hypothetical protein
VNATVIDRLAQVRAFAPHDPGAVGGPAGAVKIRCIEVQAASDRGSHFTWLIRDPWLARAS